MRNNEKNERYEKSTPDKNLFMAILGLFLLPSCTKDAYGISEGEKKADNAVCSCATDYAKAKRKAYTYAK